MKILTAAETRQADAYTIENEPIASVDLMERASMAFTNIFTKHFGLEIPVKIFCGSGNNGGDGLAVARLLLKQKYKVETWLVNFEDKGSPDFMTNLGKLKKWHSPHVLSSIDDFPDLSEHDVIIDAIFGSGLTRPIEGFYAEVIKSINKRPGKIVSIDIASGLFADAPSPGPFIIRPALTISFQTPKLAFMIPENEEFVGGWEIADIGLDREFIAKTKSQYYLLTESRVSNMVQKRLNFAHKGDFGKAIMMCGCLGKIGAAVLGAKACMRTGTGLLTMLIPQCGYEIMQTSVPEAMVVVDGHKEFLTQYPELEPYNTVGIGPGIGTQPETTQMLIKLLENYSKPMVLDADAINILGKNRFLLEKLPEESILTPHIKEFERITKPVGNHFERLDLQQKFSRKYKVIVILKGAHSSITLPDGSVYFNSTGNPGMATGGSGDVFTGILTGLLAQYYPPGNAALLGTYLHGLAGDLAAEKRGQQGMIASDIIEEIPQTYLKMKN